MKKKLDERELNDKNAQLVKEVLTDFEKRERERHPYDVQWQINMNFYMGNQYCGIGYSGLIEDIGRHYFWEEREVFNHIASKVDVRLAKLAEVKPSINVYPATNEEQDVYAAKMSKSIVEAGYERLDMENKINQATKWSEICGTAFYKVFWDEKLGQTVAIDEEGKEISSGDVNVTVCSPFEIFPDSCCTERIEDCESLIHAKVYSRTEVKNMFNVDVEGKDINIFSLSNAKNIGGLGYNGIGSKLISTKMQDSVLVIEKYIRPSLEYPNGRLIIVAGETLVHDGELPYINGTHGERGFPFIKQICTNELSSFWGSSLIERMIPIQRAYNAVKNRKHEYINRLTLGVLTVEDGSIDLDNLEDEGLAPGKILVYRQGANAPQFLGGENVPTDFEKEEEKLLNEFGSVSGTTDYSNMENISSTISGVSLELLIKENEGRLAFTTDSIKTAIKNIGVHMLKLYKQFASIPHLAKVIGTNGELEIFYFSNNDISCDDVRIDTTSYHSTDTMSQRREMIYNLLEKGLLYDENGKLSQTMKNKLFEMLGFGIWEQAKDIDALHIHRADNENLLMRDGKDVKVMEIDNHELHINEHIAYLLSGDTQESISEGTEKKFLEHIQKHKDLLKAQEIETAKNAEE